MAFSNSVERHVTHAAATSLRGDAVTLLGSTRAMSAPNLAAGLPSLTPGLLVDPKWAEEDGASPTPKEYSDMCRTVYDQHAAERTRKAADLGKTKGGAVAGVAGDGESERMLYMNFKSHIIFSEEQRAKLFGIIRYV